MALGQDPLPLGVAVIDHALASRQPCHARRVERNHRLVYDLALDALASVAASP
jgi:hypothetical protein